MDHVTVYDSQGAAYERAFQTFLAHTDQKDKAREWLDAAVARLPRHDVFLDVGAGNGKVTAWYADRFRRTIAIEPNPHLREELRQACPGAEVLPDMILEARPGAAADLVLCSHVFYYIDPAEWDANLDRLATFLAPGGLLVIILQNEGTDCMRMLAHFHGHRFEHSGLGRGFRERHGSQYEVSVETVPCHITTPDFESAYTIAEFMLNLKALPRPIPKQELADYLRKNFARPEGGFRYSCSQDFLTIRRPA